MEAVSTTGKRLFFRTMGHGEPVVLLPGSSQSHVAFLDSGLAGSLARDFTVVLMDLTGMGESERVTSMPVGQWADDVISVLDAANLSSAHLLGTSLGGRVAARVAADHPGRVDTLLIDMPITGVTDEQEARIAAMFVDYAESPLAAGWQRWHGERWRAALDFFIPLRARADFRAYYSPESYLERIEAPTLLCRSDEENLAHPLAQAFEWHQRARNSHLWIEPDAANPALTMSNAEQVAGRYATFVKAHSARN